jgi:hypothetical protein
MKVYGIVFVVAIVMWLATGFLAKAFKKKAKRNNWQGKRTIWTSLVYVFISFRPVFFLTAFLSKIIFTCFFFGWKPGPISDRDLINFFNIDFIKVSYSIPRWLDALFLLIYANVWWFLFKKASSKRGGNIWWDTFSPAIFFISLVLGIIFSIQGQAAFYGIVIILIFFVIYFLITMSIEYIRWEYKSLPER